MTPAYHLIIVANEFGTGLILRFMMIRLYPSASVSMVATGQAACHIYEQARPNSQERRRMAHIILVEDQQAQLRVLRQLIRTLCPPFTEISGVNNGQQALEVYEKYGTDLIISDQEMPVMDGSKLTRTLRSRGVTIPIIITSDNPFAAERAYEAGATVFIEKTRLISTLSKIIRYLLPQ